MLKSFKVGQLDYFSLGYVFTPEVGKLLSTGSVKVGRPLMWTSYFNDKMHLRVLIRFDQKFYKVPSTGCLSDSTNVFIYLFI